VNKICKSDRPGMRMASTSGLWLPSAVRFVSARLADATILPWALPLAGLSGTSLCIGRARPRYRSPASGPPADNSFAADDSYPLMGLLDVSFPSPASVVFPDELPPGTFECDCEVLSLREFVAALQRLDGADALFDLLQTTRPAQADSLSEVLHRP
jgi:hypothetical protein